MKNLLKSTIAIVSVLVAFTSCNNNTSNSNGALSSSNAEKVFKLASKDGVLPLPPQQSLSAAPGFAYLRASLASRRSNWRT